MANNNIIGTVKYYFRNIHTISPAIEPAIGSSMDKMKIQIRVVNGDCFQVAALYKPNDVVIHNFANNTRQGGPCSKYTEDGQFISNQEWARTQEDQLVKFYQHNLILPKAMYPICQDNKPNNEALLYSQCGALPSVITIAALQDPNYTKTQQWTTMVNRIKLMLAVCAKYNKRLITGLWGCGAFGGKPCDLMELWQEALADKKIAKPKEIIFAIKIDEYSTKWGSFEEMNKLFSQLAN